MESDSPKSWLLGSGYTWRTFAKDGVNDSRENGLSLCQTPTVELLTTEPPPSPRYKFDRLNYDIDREKREVRAYTADGKLRHRWGARDAEGNYASATDPVAWDPVDIAGDENCVFLLDQRYQAVYTHTYGRESLSLLLRSDDPDSRWSRIELDEHGCLLIFDARSNTEARCYGRGRNCLGTSPRLWPAPLAPQSAPRAQKPVPADVPGYMTEGYWLSLPIDSGIYNCQWHRIEMTLKNFPPGTEIEVKAFAYADRDQAPLN